MDTNKPYVICPCCNLTFEIEPMENRYLETECPRCALQVYVGAIYVSATDPNRLQPIVEYTQKVSVPISQELAKIESES